MSTQTELIHPDNVREEFTPVIVGDGHVVHLAYSIFGDLSTVCHNSSWKLTETTADDPRPTCRVCASPGAIDRHLRYRQYRAERAAEQEAERQRRDAEHEATMAEIRAMTEQLRERNRRHDLDRYGAVRPRKTVEQIQAETAALRAQNDQLEAELSGAGHSSD